VDPVNGRMLLEQIAGRGKEFVSNGRVVRWVADAGVLYTPGTDFDVRSGKEVAGVTFQTPGCGMISGSPNGFFGTCGMAFDRVAQEATRAQAGLHKTPCDVGTFIAEGMMFSPGGPCTCDRRQPGHQGRGPARRHRR